MERMLALRFEDRKKPKPTRPERPRPEGQTLQAAGPEPQGARGPGPPQMARPWGVRRTTPPGVFTPESEPATLRPYLAKGE